MLLACETELTLNANFGMVFLVPVTFLADFHCASEAGGNATYSDCDGRHSDLWFSGCGCGRKQDRGDCVHAEGKRCARCRRSNISERSRSTTNRSWAHC